MGCEEVLEDDVLIDLEVLAALVCCWQLFVAASVICGVEASWAKRFRRSTALIVDLVFI